MKMKVHSPCPWLMVLYLFCATLVVRAEGGRAGFYGGFNLNGLPLTIDGNAWQGKDASSLSVKGGSFFENQTVALKPPTDPDRSRMIRSSVWGSKVEVSVTDVPEGTFQVFVYVWEDNHSERFDLIVNEQVVMAGFHSGNAGTWKRLGPWRTRSSEGRISVAARGGAANLSGLEIWSGEGTVPEPVKIGFKTELTDEQADFFERRIRPLLVNNCYECHSADAKKIGGGLLLDSRAGVMKGGDTGPVLMPGYPEASLLIHAVRHADPNLTMPPKKTLGAEEIADLERWIEMGAPDPRITDTVAALAAKSAIDWEKAREFWSFRPRKQAGLPEVSRPEWPRNEIDYFILSRMEQAGLEPAGDAGRRTLIRRATFDLTGLPPAPEQIEAFLSDASPDAFAKVVERLLSSKEYGERWGRHWLDVVRYADSAGDNSDFPIPQMYRYRNWVIDAFNRDVPYDQFVRMQLAGDLLPAPGDREGYEQVIATGYIANARRFGSRVSDYPQHLTIEDTIDNLGRAFLGLTVSCARCHNHKFDPITNDDYYALYGIFHSTRYPWPGIELEQKQRDLVPLVPSEEATRAIAGHKQKQEELDREVESLEEKIKAADEGAKKELKDLLAGAKKAAETHKYTALPFEQAYAVRDSDRIEDVAVQLKGDPAKAGHVVRRGLLKVLHGEPLPENVKGSGRRELAEWIACAENPLTARVMANRVWLYHFGRGIVPTPNDFGKQGKPPSHPELLDWMAGYFVDSGWSLKAMHRKIMLSRTYQMASGLSAEAIAKDPNNELLSAFPRRRLDAEAIRDTLLKLGENLDSSAGGAHPFPPQTEWKFTQHNPFKAVYETRRRSVYLMTQRIQRHPYLAIFDGADPSASTGARLTSTTPLQALFLLNDPFVHEQARRFAERIVKERSGDAARFELASILALGRHPESFETEQAKSFLASIRSTLSDLPPEQIEIQAWESMVRAMFRLNEFVYID